VECAERAGLVLDDWQVYALERGLRVRADKKWAAFEVGVDVARQNGKGGILEARELAGLFCFGERLIIHSAHLIDTSLEAFRRLLDLIEDTPEFDREVQRVSRTNGRESIELRSGQRIRFRTRTKGGGRGFTGDCLLLDEAMFLPAMTIAALLPTLSARPNPQVWYTGSAVDQMVHDQGHIFARVRRRGIAKEKGLVYLEWSAAGDISNLDGVLGDRAAWRRANPALGIRISEKHVEDELRAMPRREFAVERLGIGDWPADDALSEAIDFEKWRALVDPRSALVDPVCLAFDVTPTREWATISAAGRRADGLLHVETIDHRPGTGWVAARIAELVANHQVSSVSCDTAGPALALVRPVENLGVVVEQLSAREYATACGALFDRVEQGQLRHLGTDDLDVAVKNASTRPLGEAWAWSRKTSGGDISPLVAATVALYQASLVSAQPWVGYW
jgi:phage terminase large subunit-like protein